MMELLILLLLSTISVSTLTSVAAIPVNDVAGQPLQKGAYYYILPVYRGKGGGPTLSPRHRTCPAQVIQENFEVANGDALTFSPANLNESTVQISADLGIVFKVATVCIKWPVWRVDDADGVSGKRYIGTDGVLGIPGPATVRNWFRIDRYGKDYKLVYCPSVCDSCRIACGDVGVFLENGNRWLGLDGEPFPVQFKKVQE